MTRVLCWNHSWHEAVHSNSTSNKHSETNGALIQSTVTHLKFTLRHQQLGHKASTGNGLWSIGVQRVSLYTVSLYLKQHCNLKYSAFIVLVHINTVSLFKTFKLATPGGGRHHNLTFIVKNASRYIIWQKHKHLKAHSGHTLSLCTRFPTSCFGSLKLPFFRAVIKHKLRWWQTVACYFVNSEIKRFTKKTLYLGVFHQTCVSVLVRFLLSSCWIFLSERFIYLLFCTFTAGKLFIRTNFG